jgi:HrpA-like RNA helicase/ribosomal protein S1
MRVAVCKDCQREIEALERTIADASSKEANKLRKQLEAKSASFTYPETDGTRKLDRGGSRSDRCTEHRREHGKHTEGMAVAYVDLATVGEVEDRENPTGPLGGLGPMPTTHDEKPASADLALHEFGMNDQDIVEILELLRDKQVLVLKAGTGTGKSTFAPYRLLDPPTREDCEELGIPVPPSGIYRLANAGPIIVTEPRVAAATGVATYVGTKLSGTGVGAGYPVGYQVSGDRNHDDACQLIFVTDGTMINWLREGRLSRIGTVIVDEAHERSTNIDFIMGYLCRDLSKYPHLRVIITSATFNTDFYEEYFGGPDVVAVKEVPAVKTVGYGMPLFPGLDTPTEREQEFFNEARWSPDLWPVISEPVLDEKRFIQAHWPVRRAPPLKETEVLDKRSVADGGNLGYQEDLYDTTEKLLPLRFEGCVPVEDWKAQMPDVLADFVVRLVTGLDEHEIFGDVLGFLPTGKTIDYACEKIRAALGDRADVFALLSTLPDKQKDDALSARKKGDKRKIVISTNLAETSLTVEGVRFVVDSGLIAQSEWNPELATGGVPTKPHSRAGIKQRWGRVGRKAPGWVFPLYTKQQYANLDEDTPPGSARENLEALIMTARLGGIDDVKAFPWPAKFNPTRTTLDTAGEEARKTFVEELDRADIALRGGGAVDDDGHPTAFGREVSRLSSFGSTASALAILYADRLACVPEVTTILALLEDERLIGQKALLVDDYDWPPEWRLEAARRHRGLASLAEDDAHLVLLACAAWERADTRTPPWEESKARQSWARRWWISNDVLVDAAKRRQEALAALSPAMKEQVKRFVEPALLDRARGVIGRTMGGMAYRLKDEGFYVAAFSEATEEPATYQLEGDALTGRTHQVVIAMRRRDKDGARYISNLIAVPSTESETSQATSVRDAMDLVREFRKSAPPDRTRNRALTLMARYPVGTRLRVCPDDGDRQLVAAVLEDVEPSERPPTQAEQDEHGISRRKKRRRRQFDATETDGTASDFAGEIQRVVKRGVDDDAEAERTFARTEELSDDAVPCGVCDLCRSGRESECRKKTSGAGLGYTVDALAEWNSQSSNDTQANAISIRSDADILSEGWCEVADYDLASNPPAVRIIGRSPSSGIDTEDLGEHAELTPGQTVDVEVGELDQTHSGAVRVFYRVDGGGRCVVSEAGRSAQDRHGAIGMSLDRFAFGLLEGLKPGALMTATAVPTGAKGQMTVTLLEALHAHVKTAERTMAMPIPPPVKGRARHELRAIARVLTAQDERGRTRVELAIVDKAAGIQHYFELRGLSAADNGDDAQEQTEPDPPPCDQQEKQSPTTTVSDGDALRIEFTQNNVPLSVTGIDLPALAEILRQADRQLRFRGSAESQALVKELSKRRPARTGDEDEAHQADDGPSAGPRDQITASGAPVHRSIAKLLADLDPDPSWQREVWAFWARSHHLKPSKVAPADSYDEHDSSISNLRRTEQTPLEQRRTRFEEFTAEHGKGARVSGTITTIDGRDVYVELEPGLDVRIPSGELRWGEPRDDPADYVALGDDVELEITNVNAEDLRLTGSARALTEDPVPPFIASHPAGTLVRGTVKALPESGNVWVQLLPGFDGQVLKRDVAWDPSASAADLLAIGDSVELKVLSANAESRVMKFSLRETTEHPNGGYVARNPVGTTVSGTVQELVSNGRLAIVDLGGGVRARLPISEAGHARLDSLEEVLAVGETLDAKLTRYDADSQHLTLSAKALLPTPWDALVDSSPQGRTLVGRVDKIIPKSVFIDLGQGLRGKIFIKYLSSRFINHPSEVVSEGQWVQVRVIGLDLERKLVQLAYAGPATKPAGCSTPTRISRSVDSAGESAAAATDIRGPTVRPTPSPRTARAGAQPRTEPANRKAPSRPRAPKLAPFTPRKVEVEGKTVVEAVERGLRQLSVTDVNRVDVEVLRDPVRGLLGRLKEPARVRLTTRPDVESTR